MWPFPDQPLHSNGVTQLSTVLFPGCSPGGHNTRMWTKPISERAYYARLIQASTFIHADRLAAHGRGETHVFDNFNLTKLATHSMKKSSVVLLKDNFVSTAIVAAITGTSPRVIDKHYDTPNSKRMRKAANDTFNKVVGIIRDDLQMGGVLLSVASPKFSGSF